MTNKMLLLNGLMAIGLVLFLLAVWRIVAASDAAQRTFEWEIERLRLDHTDT